MNSALSVRHLRILLILANGPTHGYAIGSLLKEEDGIVLRPGSLYRAIHQLIERGCITEIDDVGADPRRRSYDLTEAGRRELADGLADLRRLVEQGRALGFLGGVS